MNKKFFNIVFALVILGSSGCTSETKVVVQEHFYTPNSFSPNGDGLNDTFHIYPHPNVQLSECHMSIYSESLQPMFETDDIVLNPWDGNYNGTPAPTGNYTYQIVYVASVDSGAFISYYGSSEVTLVR